MSRSSKSIRSERRMPKGIPVYISLDLVDLRGGLQEGLTQRELLKLIINIDKDVEDWDFTMKLHGHFAAQAKLYKKECGGDS
jgi:hypothetical protein